MSQPQSSITLIQRIGFWSATAIVVGSIIGSGIFINPAIMARQLGSPVWLILVWIIGGIFSFLGALVFAELGGMMPETGGIYVYFRRMFGDFVAFLYGWSAFAVINTAAIAAIAFVCAKYSDFFFHLPGFNEATANACVWHIPFIGDLYPLKDFGVKSLAVVIIMSLSLLNYFSVKAASAFQLISTIIKIGLIVALIAGIFFSSKGSVGNFTVASHPQMGLSLITAIVVSLTWAFYSYDGWINVTFIAGEIKAPQKNISRSLALGVLVCVVVYVLINLAYLYVLPVEQMGASELVAADAMGRALGKTSEAIAAALIVICTFGAVNGNLMSTCRITYAMGKDRVFHSWTGKAHPRYHTPGNAIWLQGIWASVFIITGSFDMLANMFVFITWIAYGMGALGVFLLRKKMPDHPRPYKVWGYPFIPALFIIFSLFYLVITVYNDVSNYLNHRQPIINSVLGMVITALGIPLYFYFKRKN